MDQAEVVTGASRHLCSSGQVAVEPDSSSEFGIAVVSPNDIRGQLEHALSDVDAVLATAGMGRENVTSLRLFTTDVDGILANYDVYAGWIAVAGTRSPQLLLGVQRLVLPGLVVEIEATEAQ